MDSPWSPVRSKQAPFPYVYFGVIAFLVISSFFLFRGVGVGLSIVVALIWRRSFKSDFTITWKPITLFIYTLIAIPLVSIFISAIARVSELGPFGRFLAELPFIRAPIDDVMLSSANGSNSSAHMASFWLYAYPGIFWGMVINVAVFAVTLPACMFLKVVWKNTITPSTAKTLAWFVACFWLLGFTIVWFGHVSLVPGSFGIGRISPLTLGASIWVVTLFVVLNLRFLAIPPTNAPIA